MDWLRIPEALGLILVCAFSTSYLSSAWERRRKRDESVDRLIAALPGFNCGLCGRGDCRGFARYLIHEKGDPGLCAPGGEATEEGVRKLLGGEAATVKVAFVRCGATNSQAKEIFTYDGRPDCIAAAQSYLGQRACTSACLGFGTCAKACPIGAIKVSEGLARVDPELCTGCGLCIQVCPTSVIALVSPRASWQVACNAVRLPPSERLKDCSAACTGCGDCERLSASWEFSLSGGLARSSERQGEEGSPRGDYPGIARRCPTGAIIRCGAFGRDDDGREAHVEVRSEGREIAQEGDGKKGS